MVKEGQMPKVYIRCDAMNRVNSIESEPRISNLDEWILVDEGEGDKYENPRELYLGHHILVKPATMGDAGIPAYYYKFENGKIVERTAAEIQADIAAIPPPPPDPLQVTQKAATVMFRALAQTDVITAEDALDNAGMFPVWSDCIGQRAEPGSYWRHGGKLWRVNAGQGHTIQADWPPDHAASLFSLAANPAEEWPEWIQPTGAHNAYKKGDKVAYKGKMYISKIEANVWAPDAYPAGWEVQ